MPILHPLDPSVSPQSLAAFTHHQLCELSGLKKAHEQAEAFELTPELTSQLNTQFFDETLTMDVFFATEWRIRSETSVGWEIVRINETVIRLLAGANGECGSAPIEIDDYPVKLDEKADLDWLADWPQIKRLHLPHSLRNLDFLRHLPQLESLTLEDIRFIEDFTPLNHPTFLGRVAIGNGNGSHLDPTAILSQLAKLRSQVFNIPDLDASLWIE
jgi:hypothetical protein